MDPLDSNVMSEIGVEAICEFEGYEGLEEVHLFVFRKQEIDILQKVLNGLIR